MFNTIETTPDFSENLIRIARAAGDAILAIYESPNSIRGANF